MRILGIDPGLRITGFGIIEKKGMDLSYIASGTVHTPTQADLPERLKTILNSIAEIIDTYHPHCAAIEKVFVNVNPQSTLLLGQARGAAICALVKSNLTISEYTALQIKQAVVGHGKAQKKQVQDMVKRLLSLPAPPKSDAADALGVAICHANMFDALNAMHEAAGLKSKSGFRIRRGRLIR
ncbi:MAG: crossover junction endodeoxyribonuclease RuvC [Betaproteobacteria bacterium]|nr:crossover junction endodeoxyribonuclease RuvC [Betaproteobacteria bacterium]